MSSASASQRRIGVFGGTFDPPHLGHLLACSDAAERLDLMTVLWVPARAQPLKGAAPPVATTDDRRRMVELTIAGDPRFALDPTELEREGLSFTVDTLTDLRGRYPAGALFLLLGEDSWRTFAAWRDPGRILDLASVVVLTRHAGTEPVPPLLHGKESGDAPIRVGTRRIDISATEIRQRVREGRSVRGFVTEGVEQFIRERRLYRGS